METKWSTTIDPKDLEEWIKTKYGNKDEFIKVYKEQWIWVGNIFLKNTYGIW